MLFTEFDEKAYAEAVHQDGYEEGQIDKVLSLFLKDKLSREDAIEESGLTEAEFDRALDNYRKAHTA